MLHAEVRRRPEPATGSRFAAGAAADAVADASRTAPVALVTRSRRLAVATDGRVAMFERRLYYHVDWAMLAAVLALCADRPGADLQRHRRRRPASHVTQIYGIVLGLLALVVCLSIDYRSLADKSHFIYLGVLALLVYVLFFGVVRGGSRRWIDLGPLNLQPSEFAKAAVALVLAKFFGESRRGAITRGDLLIAGALTAVPFLVIARQPDLGHGGHAAARAVRRRLRGRHADADLRHPRARRRAGRADRVEVRAPGLSEGAHLDVPGPRGRTRRGAGYQQIQARITVGSGGLWGKGFKKGTQGQLRFLPVAHNDFIFSVLAEEHGFAGVLVALGLYLFVILRSLEAARLAKDRLGRVPGAGSAGQLHVPGDVQHHDVGRPGAGQGSDASAHELRRLLHDCHAGGIRPDSQRADAPIYELESDLACQTRTPEPGLSKSRC